MNRKDLFSNGITAVLTVCAVTVTVLFVMREMRSAPAEAQAASVLVANWESMDDGPLREGSPEAPIAIIEFFDYECPYCGAMAETISALRQKYPEEVRIVYKNLPLKNHPNAYPSARASLCAASQGRFEAYHAHLFKNQKRLAEIRYDSLAQRLGVPDLDAFRSCMETEEIPPAIRADEQLARSLGIRSIPTLIVNGQLVSGALSLEQLELLVAQATDLAARRPSQP